MGLDLPHIGTSYLLAILVAGNPELLMLDEPSPGLPPLGPADYSLFGVN